jgi:tRNA dimethylallyltransferase
LRHLDALNTVGYKEWFDYFDGTYSTVHETISKIKQHTRNYAKRQLTWLRKDPHWQNVTANEVEQVLSTITAK